MPSLGELAKRFYYAAEDKYYSLMDFLEERVKIPVYEYFVEPIETRGIPSFPVALFLLFMLVGILAFLLWPQPSNVTLSVYVTKPGGKPVPNAVITLSGLSPEGKELVKNSSSFGEASFADLPPKTVELLVEKNGFNSSDGTVDLRKELSKAFVLLPIKGSVLPYSATLRILNDKGSPIKGASVTLTSSKGEQKTLETAGDGIVQVSAAKSGESFDFTASADGYETGSGSISIQEKSKDFTLYKARAPEERGKVTVIVYDNESKRIEADVSLYDEGNALIDALRTSGGQADFGEVAPVGSQVYPMAKPLSKAFLPGGGASYGKRVTKSGTTFQIILKPKVGNSDSLTVFVKDASTGDSLDAQVSLFVAGWNPQIPIDSAKASGGRVDFDYEKGLRVYATAFLEGYLPAYKVPDAGAKEVTISLQKVTGIKHGNVTVTVLDPDDALVESASTTVIAFGGYSLGVPSQKTDSSGNASFYFLPTGSLVAIASHEDLSGSKDFLLGNEAKSVIVRLLPPNSNLTVHLKDAITNSPINGRVDVLYQQEAFSGCYTLNRGWCKLPVPGGKNFTVKATANGYATMTVTESVEPKMEESTEISMIPSSMSNDTIAIFKGFVPFGSRRTSNSTTLGKGTSYSAIFILNIPQGADKGGFYARLGDDESISSYPAYILQSLNQPGATITSSDSFDSSCAPSTTQPDYLKWANYEYSNPAAGAREVQVPVFVRPLQNTNSMKLNYRAYSVIDASYLRNPVDPDLGDEESIPAKPYCKAKTNVIQSTLLNGASNCTAEACITLSFINPSGEPVYASTFTTQIPNRFDLASSVTPLKAISTPQFTISADSQALSFENYSLSPSSQAPQNGYLLSWQLGSQLTPSNPVSGVGKAAPEFSTTETVRAWLNYSYAQGNQPPQQKGVQVSVSVIIQDDPNAPKLNATASPRNFTAGDSSKVNVTVLTPQGAPVTNATVSLKRQNGLMYPGAANNPIFGDGQEGRGRNGIYTFTASNGNDINFDSPELVLVSAKLTGFKPGNNNFTVSEGLFPEISLARVNELRLSSCQQNLTFSTRIASRQVGKIDSCMVFNDTPSDFVSANVVPVCNGLIQTEKGEFNATSYKLVQFMANYCNPIFWDVPQLNYSGKLQMQGFQSQNAANASISVLKVLSGQCKLSNSTLFAAYLSKALQGFSFTAGAVVTSGTKVIFNSGTTTSSGTTDLRFGISPIFPTSAKSITFVNDDSISKTFSWTPAPSCVQFRDFSTGTVLSNGVDVPARNSKSIYAVYLPLSACVKYSVNGESVTLSILKASETVSFGPSQVQNKVPLTFTPEIVNSDGTQAGEKIVFTTIPFTKLVSRTQTESLYAFSNNVQVENRTSQGVSFIVTAGSTQSIQPMDFKLGVAALVDKINLKAQKDAAVDAGNRGITLNKVSTQDFGGITNWDVENNVDDAPGVSYCRDDFCSPGRFDSTTNWLSSQSRNAVSAINNSLESVTVVFGDLNQIKGIADGLYDAIASNATLMTECKDSLANPLEKALCDPQKSLETRAVILQKLGNNQQLANAFVDAVCANNYAIASTIFNASTHANRSMINYTGIMQGISQAAGTTSKILDLSGYQFRFVLKRSGYENGGYYNVSITKDGKTETRLKELPFAEGGKLLTDQGLNLYNMNKLGATLSNYIFNFPSNAPKELRVDVCTNVWWKVDGTIGYPQVQDITLWCSKGDVSTCGYYNNPGYTFSPISGRTLQIDETGKSDCLSILNKYKKSIAIEPICPGGFKGSNECNVQGGCISSTGLSLSALQPYCLVKDSADAYLAAELDPNEKHLRVAFAPAVATTPENSPVPCNLIVEEQVTEFNRELNYHFYKGLVRYFTNEVAKLEGGAVTGDNFLDMAGRCGCQVIERTKLRVVVKCSASGMVSGGCSDPSKSEAGMSCDLQAPPSAPGSACAYSSGCFYIQDKVKKPVPYLCGTSPATLICNSQDTQLGSVGCGNTGQPPCQGNCFSGVGGALSISGSSCYPSCNQYLGASGSRRAFVGSYTSPKGASASCGGGLNLWFDPKADDYFGSKEPTGCPLPPYPDPMPSYTPTCKFTYRENNCKTRVSSNGGTSFCGCAKAFGPNCCKDLQGCQQSVSQYSCNTPPSGEYICTQNTEYYCNADFSCPTTLQNAINSNWNCEGVDGSLTTTCSW